MSTTPPPFSSPVFITIFCGNGRRPDMTTRKVFFWLHLSAGCLAGIVIFIMSLTGVMLAWQRQIIHWADGEFHHQPEAGQAKLGPETLFTTAAATKGAAPTALILRSAADEPAAAEFGREGTLYLNPYTGQ